MKMNTKYTMWIDYGLEGWKPSDFKNLQDIADAIKDGLHYGRPFRVTRELQVKIEMVED